MTLNLMLVSPSAVYLSGDFRLTYPATGHWKDDPTAQKLVPVFKFGWSALVSFAGLAKTPHGLDMGDWISDTAQKIAMDAPFDALPKALLEAQKWISVSGSYALVLTIVGFIQRRPVVTVMSNCLDAKGNLLIGRYPVMQVSAFRPKKSEMRAIGDAGAVPLDRRRHLTALLSQHAPPRQIEMAMAQINAESSRRATGISSTCVTGHLLPSGEAEVTPHGMSDSVEYMPGFVRRSLLASGIRGFKLKVDKNGRLLPPVWVGMTARIQGKAVGTINTIRNVEGPVTEIGLHDQRLWKLNP